MGLVETEVLRELNHEFSVLRERLPDMDITSPGKGWAIYDVAEGTCIGLNLDYEDEAAAQKVYMAEGTVFPWHTHEGHETLVSRDVVLEVELPDGTMSKINPGESIHFAPEVAHQVKALTAGYIYGISVPADKAYPSE